MSRVVAISSSRPSVTIDRRTGVVMVRGFGGGLGGDGRSTVTQLFGLDNGSNLPGAVLQAEIDALLAAGVNPLSIIWYSTGSETEGVSNGAGTLTAVSAATSVAVHTGIGSVVTVAGTGSLTALSSATATSAMTGAGSTGSIAGAGIATGVAATLSTAAAVGVGETVPVAGAGSATEVSVAATVSAATGVGATVAVAGTGSTAGVSATTSTTATTGMGVTGSIAGTGALAPISSSVGVAVLTGSLIGFSNTDQWLTTTAGGGTVAIDGAGAASINTLGGGKAAAIVYKNGVPRTEAHTYKLKFKLLAANTTDTFPIFYLAQAAPQCDTVGVIASTYYKHLGIGVTWSPAASAYQCNAFVQYSADFAQKWGGSAWVANSSWVDGNFGPLALNTEYVAIVTTSASGITFAVKTADEVTTIFNTASVVRAWANTWNMAGTGPITAPTLYPFFGDIYTDAFAINFAATGFEVI